MAALSNRVIETLIDLVENKLVDMSSDRHEGSPQYQELQECRYSLLAMVANAEDAVSPENLPAARKTRFGHLQVIPGGRI